MKTQRSPHGGGEGKAPVGRKRHLLHGVNLRLSKPQETRNKKAKSTNLSFVVVTKNNLVA